MSNLQHLLELAQTPMMQALAATLLGVVAAYRKYKRTGQLKLHELPLRAFRQLVYALRGAFFSKPRPRKLAHVNQPISDVREQLISLGFEDSWYVSYQYRGEDGNLRRPDGLMDGKNRQLHVRLWDAGDSGTEIAAHREFSPIQHPKLHLQNAELEPADEAVVALLTD